jgi:hypothetical protein
MTNTSPYAPRDNPLLDLAVMSFPHLFIALFELNVHFHDNEVQLWENVYVMLNGLQNCRLFSIVCLRFET